MIVTAFDTETTGLPRSRLSPLEKQPEITELYACHFDDESGKVVDEFDSLFKTRKSIPPETVKINGIDDEMVKDCKPFSNHCEKVIKFLNHGERVTGHNIRFDIDMVGFEVQRCAYKGIIFPQKRLCTIEQTMHLRGKRLKLGILHELLFGETFEDAHRAKADVQAQVRCYMELKKRGVI